MVGVAFKALTPEARKPFEDEALVRKEEYAAGTELVLWQHVGQGQESIVCTIEEQLGVPLPVKLIVQYPGRMHFEHPGNANTCCQHAILCINMC